MKERIVYDSGGLEVSGTRVGGVGGGGGGEAQVLPPLVRHLCHRLRRLIKVPSVVPVGWKIKMRVFVAGLKSVLLL